MKVFKFGGASVKDSDGIKGLFNIVREEKDRLVIVVSAFGKTTNALEGVLKAWFTGDPAYQELLDSILTYHISIYDGLFNKKDPEAVPVRDSFRLLKDYLKTGKPEDWDFEYDQVVSFGEIWSTTIVSEFLNYQGLRSEWIDIRKVLITDSTYRDANVLQDESTKRIHEAFNDPGISFFVTQGFIGGTLKGKYTTLGREGSDYTAAILANVLNAESVTVWKDVPGLLNADPKWLGDAQKLDEVSYREAVEMTFSGAKVIHPKTIKPLHNKNIPLYVRSFLDPSQKGTLITSDPALSRILPVFVRKEGQILLSILPKDFSFVPGEKLSSILHMFMAHGIKVNLVEASAVSLDVCVDDERTRITSLISDLEAEYSVIYNDNVEILSIRHYSQEAVDRLTGEREVLLEQRTRSSVRFVVR